MTPAPAERAVPFEALLREAPVGFAYFDSGLRFREVNQKLADINGLPIEEHLGRTVPELLPEMDASVEDTLRRVLETGERLIATEFVGKTLAGANRRRITTSLYPVRGESGEVIGIGCVALDVTERREAEAEREHVLGLEREARAQAEDATRRARFMANAGVILDETLDYEQTLTTVSRLAVPWLADWCAVDVVGADGSLERVNTAHVDPAKVALAEEIQRRYPEPEEGELGLPNVLRTGRSEIYPEISDELLARGAQDDEHLELLRAVGIRSVMLVPMIARGRTLGVITFVASDTGRVFGDLDLMLAEELARRAATAVHTAVLYGERAYVARTLQESLLPPHLPDVPGIDLAALYRPAGEGNEVGGDFYDVFQVGPGEWAVLIGDVCGKGAGAAALTALVRYTIRAIASVETPPREILRRVNDEILRQRSDGRFCTIAYARLSVAPAGTRIVASIGGHPLPLVLRASGPVEVLGEPGTLLGVVPDPALHDHAVQLGPGDSVVLYTDGITEAGAPDRLLSEEDLAAVAAGCGSLAAEDVAACLERKAAEMSNGVPHDDIAIVVLHLPPEVGVSGSGSSG